MARLQIADLNPSESGLLYELTDEELLDINGGGLFRRIFGAVLSVAGLAVAAFVTAPLAPLVGVGIAVAGGIIGEAFD